jgi:putative membrane protein
MDADSASGLLRHLIAYAHALRHHLRGSDPARDLDRWLPADTRDAVLTAPNRPSALLARTGVAFADASRVQGIEPILLAAIDAELGKLSHVLGGCERIQGTPIPFAYILLLHRTVHIYCFLLPFCLVGLMGWFTPLVVGVLAYTFFGLDALGDQIEDPFGTLPNDLPIEAYSTTVENDLMALDGAAPPRS